MPDVREKVKETVLQEVDRLGVLSKDAVRSGVYLYPVKVRRTPNNPRIILGPYPNDRLGFSLLQGILYYLTHRHLWAPLLSQLVPMITLSVIVTVLMFTFVYLPQVAVLSVVNGPLAVVGAGMLVVSESSAVVLLVGRWAFVEGALVDTFDAVSWDGEL